MNRTQALSTSQRRSQFTRLWRSTLSVTEEDKLLRIAPPLQTVLDLADTFQRLAQTHLRNRTSQDGLFQKLAESVRKEGDQIEIKLMTPDLPLEDKPTQRIEPARRLTSDQATVNKQISLERSRTKCKEGVA